MILCAGEALIDMLPRQSTDGENAFAPLAGGSVFNTSIALGRLGAPVQFFCGLSSDLFGDVLRQELATSKVDSRLTGKGTLTQPGHIRMVFGADAAKKNCTASVNQILYGSGDIHKIGWCTDDQAIRFHQFFINSLHVIINNTLAFIHHAHAAARAGLDIAIAHIYKFELTLR